MSGKMRFDEGNQEFFLGPLRACSVGYASDAEVRSRSASGGLVSSALIHLLESGQVEGALCCRLEANGGRLKGRPFIATGREEVLASAGSIYLEVNPLSNMEMVRSFPGRLAMVGLPCHLESLRRMIAREPALGDKIVLTIGLFCGHNSQRELVETVLAKRRVDLGRLRSFRFRRGLWRGRSWVHYDDGSVLNFPFQVFSRYQNLHFFSLRRCLRCADHTAELADMSVGDLWSKRFKSKPIKHSVIMQRSLQGQELVDQMIQEGRARMEPCEPGEVFLAQKRALTCHKSLYARSRLGPLLGLDIPAAPKTPTPWNHWLASLILLLNVKWSSSRRWKPLIFRLPKPLLQGYLLLFKGLTHI
jgi:coenzyme F420 hydrogenase subunit beta